MKGVGTLPIGPTLIQWAPQPSIYFNIRAHENWYKLARIFKHITQLLQLIGRSSIPSNLKQVQWASDLLRRAVQDASPSLSRSFRFFWVWPFVRNEANQSSLALLSRARALLIYRSQYSSIQTVQTTKGSENGIKGDSTAEDTFSRPDRDQLGQVPPFLPLF